MALLIPYDFNLNAAEPPKVENAEKLTETERIKLEYYILKIKDINSSITELENKRLPFIKGYQDYYAELMKIYSRDAKKFNINLQDGTFIEIPNDNQKAK